MANLSPTKGVMIVATLAESEQFFTVARPTSCGVGTDFGVEIVVGVVMNRAEAAIVLAKLRETSPVEGVLLPDIAIVIPYNYC